MARRYVEETLFPWSLLVDEKCETYRNYGMFSASFWDVWGPKMWWLYVKEIVKGQKVRKSAGDTFQYTVFLFIVIVHHLSFHNLKTTILFHI